jgi:hypothetical protein
VPRLRFIALGLVALAPSIAFAGKPIAPGATWAFEPDDDLGTPWIERELGITQDELDEMGGRWEGDMLFTPDGLGADALAALGQDPLHAMAYDAVVGVLYVEMNGVTIKPTCGNGDAANAALNCSPLVDSETQFPAYGNGSAQAATFQELQNYYDPFNIVMTSQRPPDWVPYTMAVIGGASNQGGGVCGVANVACDGLKRNHVSLTFPESCGGVSEIAAQETSHNWGLEHVDDQTDLMYPFNNGGFKTYTDECHTVDHSTGGAVTQCGYIHEIYCPAGMGEQQNSYQELMGVFGARQADTVAPEITDVQPADGSVFHMSDSINITATVSEDSHFLAAKWTWVEGPLPDGVTEYTRCTNKVCTNSYDLTPGTDPNTVAWDFINLQGSPEGHYTFKFEVLDAYANYDSTMISIDVIPDGQDTATGPETGSDGTSAESGTSPPDTGSDGDNGTGEGSAEGTSSVGQDGGEADGPGKNGCACDAGRSPLQAAWALPIVALMLPRRRR